MSNYQIEAVTAPTRTEFEAAALPPLPAIPDEGRQFLHYNPNTQDVVDFVQGYAVEYAKLAVAAHAAQTERERFEAAAYRWAREHEVLMWKLTGDRKAPFTSATGKNLDTAIATAMGWPTAPEVKS